MKTRNISVSESALEVVNLKFEDNVKMDITQNWTSSGMPRHSIKVGVHSSFEPGGRYNPNSGRHIAAACWHVFGELLDALGAICQDDALVVLFADQSRLIVHPADHGWIDRNIGSMYQPLYYSESCHCQ